MKKLEFDGTCGVRDFLRSYISDRSQYVSLFNSTSFVNNVMFVVSHRSDIGAVLYNLHANDIVNVPRQT